MGENVAFYVSSTLSCDNAPRYDLFHYGKKYTFNGFEGHFDHVWAPEMHYVDGKYKIYFNAWFRLGTEKYPTIYVAEPQNLSDLLSTNWNIKRFEFKASSNMGTNQAYAIDSNVMTYGSNRYLLFSYFRPLSNATWTNCPGTPDGRVCFTANGTPLNDDLNHKPQRIGIVQMDATGTKAVSDVVIIADPDGDVDPVTGKSKRFRFEEQRVNEGPAVIFRGDKPVVIYSGGFYSVDNYNLKQLDYIGSSANPSDVLNPASWQKIFKNSLVASSSSTRSVFGPGHCAFVLDESNQFVIVYHARKTSSNVDQNLERFARAETVWWSGTFLTLGPPNDLGKPKPVQWTV